MDLEKNFLVDGTAVIGTAAYLTTVNSGNHTIIADEPVEDGGMDTGMSPYSLLLASLASCTAITLRMYINRKGWPIDHIEVKIEMYRTDQGIFIESRLKFGGVIDDAQRKRLITIADACPIHKILVGNITINTSISDEH